jgi:hypothetical protein
MMAEVGGITHSTTLKLYISRFITPGQCRSQIVVLALKPLQPCALIRAMKLRLSRFGQDVKEECVPLPNADDFPVFHQTFKSVLADRLQHHEARLAVHILRAPYQAFIDQ